MLGALLGAGFGLVLYLTIDNHRMTASKLDRLHAHCSAVAVHLTDDAKLLQDTAPERRDLGRHAYLELIGGDDLELCTGKSATTTVCHEGDDACLAREALGLVEELRKP